MKKLTPKRKAWHGRLVKKRRRRPKLVRYKFYLGETTRTKKGQQRITITAPPEMDFSEANSPATMAFFSDLRKLSNAKVLRGYVNLKLLKKISPLCALYLASEFDRWKKSGAGRLHLRDRDHMDQNVKQVLQDVGVWDYLGPNNRPYQPSTKDKIIYLGIKSGFAVEREVADNLQAELSRICSFFHTDLSLNDGIVEAMQNVSGWAYKVSTSKNRKRWWLCAGYNRGTNTAHFMICDHGRGIPKTLPISRFFQRFGISSELIRGIFNSGDGNIIKKAMQIGRSASGLSNRGKGLKDMVDYITAQKRGQLRIISRHGDYSIDQNMSEIVRDHPLPLAGTIIAWSVYLEDTRGDHAS